MKTAKYDISFSPMVSVIMPVENPEHPSENEMNEIKLLAKEKAFLLAKENITVENIDSVTLMSEDNTPVKQIVPDTLKLMQKVLSLLQNVMKSNYIPMTTPCPSSTEKLLKEALEQADCELRVAIKLHNTLYK